MKWKVAHDSDTERVSRLTGSCSVYRYDEKVYVIQDTCRSHLRLDIGFLILPS